MKLDATFENAPLALSNFYMSKGKAEKAVKVLVNFVFSYGYQKRSVYYEICLLVKNMIV